MTVDRSDIVAAARGYLGTPFMHQGRSRLGVDCAGLLTCVAYDLGIKDVRVTDYGRLPDSKRAQSILDEHMSAVPFAEIGPGDALSFVILQEVQHFGILTEPGRFIHAYDPVGKVIEQSLVGAWLKRLRRCYRFI